MPCIIPCLYFSWGMLTSSLQSFLQKKLYVCSVFFHFIGCHAILPNSDCELMLINIVTGWVLTLFFSCYCSIWTPVSHLHGGRYAQRWPFPYSRGFSDTQVSTPGRASSYFQREKQLSGRALDFQSEDPGFVPLAGQVEGEGFFGPFNCCADLFVPDPPSCVWHPKDVLTLKIPYASVLKE